MKKCAVTLTLICFLYIMDQWLKRGTSSKQLSTTTPSTDVTDNVNEAQHFILPFSTDSPRTAESKKKKRKVQWLLIVSADYIHRWWNCPLHYVSCAAKCYQTVLLPAKLCKHHYNYHAAHKDKDISSFKPKIDTLTNSQTLMMNNKNTWGLLQNKIPYCT